MIRIAYLQFLCWHHICFVTIVKEILEETMGLFKRAKDIFTANVNSMLDQAENPEAMINQIIRELEVAISDLKCSCANKLAEKKTLERRIEELNAAILRWSNRAEVAVKSGKDNLAKEALKERSIITEKMILNQAQFDRIDENIDQCKDETLKLEEKLIEMITRKKELLTRVERAEEKNYTNNIINKANGSDILDKFSRFESKIERMEAEAEIFSPSAHTQFEKMEQESLIDEELKLLKAKMKNTK